MTKQEEIVVALMARLTAGLPSVYPPILPPTGLKTPHRSPARSLDDDDLPTYAAMVVENAEDEDVPEVDGAWLRVLWVWVEARAHGDVSDPDGSIDATMDPFVDYALSVLLTEPSLGGLVDRIVPNRVIYEGWEGKRVYCTAGMLFKLHYIAAPI